MVVIMLYATFHWEYNVSCIVISLTFLVSGVASVSSFPSFMLLLVVLVSIDLITLFGPFKITAVVVVLSLSAAMMVKRHFRGRVMCSGK